MRRLPLLSTLLFPFLLFGLLPAAALAARGDVIVTFSERASASQRAETRRSVGVRAKYHLGLKRVQLLSTPPGMSAAQASKRLKRMRLVESASPDRKVFSDDLLSDESRGEEQWELRQPNDADVDGPEAWGSSVGAGATVAVIDTGVDTTHPDLAGQLWNNPGEVPGNGLDDDGNGGVDDLHGWNYGANNNDVGPVMTGTGPNGHGTHVAGIIAAASNRQGTIGLAPAAKIMVLNVADPGAANPQSTSSSSSNIIRGVLYAAAEGAQVASISLSGGAPTSEYDAPFQAVAGQISILVSAGNNAQNLDQTGRWPCMAAAPNLRCIGSSQRDDTISPESNFSDHHVDLFAPGNQILSTRVGGGYDLRTGTSMATPLASATVALMVQAFPSLSPIERLDRLALGDRPRALAGRSVSGVRLNAALALGASAGGPSPFSNSLSPATSRAGQAVTVTAVNPPAGASSFRYSFRSELSTGDRRESVEDGPSTSFRLPQDEDCDQSYRLNVSVVALMPDGSRISSEPKAYAIRCQLTGNDDTGKVLRLFGDGKLGSSRADRLRGGSRGDALMGRGSTDRLLGGGGGDLLAGGEGGDRLYGEAGDDMIGGENGKDRSYGGAGDDIIADEEGNDLLAGGSGNDILLGGLGSDRLDGGLGNDLLYGQSGNDRLTGGPGSGKDRLYGGPGVDAAHGGFGNDIVSGGDGDDSPCYLRGQKVKEGTRGCSHSPLGVIRATGGDEGRLAGIISLQGQGGGDTVFGGEGDDALGGGADSDRLYGGPGADLLSGGSGDDVLFGGEGADVLVGEAGNDVILVDAADSLVAGGPGNDSIGANDGRATGAEIDCGEGDDILALDEQDGQVRHRNCENVQLTGSHFTEPAPPSDGQPAAFRPVRTSLTLTKRLARSHHELYRLGTE